jgi:hypothetical protein
MSENGEQPITPSQIVVRDVTHYQFTWTEVAPGEDGVWTCQLILDQGADEYVLRLSEDDADNLQDLFESAGRVTFDLERKVLMFGTRAVGS